MHYLANWGNPRAATNTWAEEHKIRGSLACCSQAYQELHPGGRSLEQFTILEISVLLLTLSSQHSPSTQFPHPCPCPASLSLSHGSDLHKLLGKQQAKERNNEHYHGYIWMLAVVYPLKNYLRRSVKVSQWGLWLSLHLAASPVLIPWDPAVLSPGTFTGIAVILVIVVSKHSRKWRAVGNQSPLPGLFCCSRLFQ